MLASIDTPDVEVSTGAAIPMLSRSYRTVEWRESAPPDVAPAVASVLFPAGTAVAAPAVRALLVGVSTSVAVAELLEIGKSPPVLDPFVVLSSVPAGRAARRGRVPGHWNRQYQAYTSSDLDSPLQQELLPPIQTRPRRRLKQAGMHLAL
jgi:hypothetical protein